MYTCEGTGVRTYERSSVYSSTSVRTYVHSDESECVSMCAYVRMLLKMMFYKYFKFFNFLYLETYERA